MNVIPKKPEAYSKAMAESIANNCRGLRDATIFFTSRDGEQVRVVSYVRYPSYDMIFAVPVKESWRAEKEIGYFEFRNAKTGKCWGLWVDETEAREIISGFQAMLYESKKN